MAKDFWILSYLCNGINFTDIAHLEWHNIEQDRIIFERRKTMNTIRSNAEKIVVIRNPKIDNLIKKWSNDNSSMKYVFKIINENDSPLQSKLKIKQFIKVVNSHLKKIGNELELPIKLTTYVARHSFATMIVRGGAPLEFAKQSLGHKNITTTQKYFAGFDSTDQKKFTKVLLEF